MACLCKKVQFLFRNSVALKGLRYTSGCWSYGRRSPYSTKEPSEEEEEDNEPVKYSTSKAATWRARQTHSGGSNSDAPDYQGYVVSVSTAVFLIYFCVLREENDIDEELSKPLYDRIEGLKEKQLEIALKYNLDHGLPTRDIERELQALRDSSE